MVEWHREEGRGVIASPRREVAAGRTSLWSESPATRRWQSETMSISTSSQAVRIATNIAHCVCGRQESNPAPLIRTNLLTQAGRTAAVSPSPTTIPKSRRSSDRASLAATSGRIASDFGGQVSLKLGTGYRESLREVARCTLPDIIRKRHATLDRTLD